VGCKACGKCCTYIALEVGDYGIPWLELHGVPLVDEGGKIKVIFDAPCKHQDPVTKLCSIHDEERPQICEDYLCEEARRGTMDLREALLKRKEELQADMNAIGGALQQIDWTLKELEREAEDAEVAK